MAKEKAAEAWRGMWWACVFFGAVLGAIFAGQPGASFGGLIGFAVMMVLATVEAIRDARRKRAAEVEALKREEDENDDETEDAA